MTGAGDGEGRPNGGRGNEENGGQDGPPAKGPPKPCPKGMRMVGAAAENNQHCVAEDAPPHHAKYLV